MGLTVMREITEIRLGKWLSPKPSQSAGGDRQVNFRSTSQTPRQYREFAPARVEGSDARRR